MIATDLKALNGKVVLVKSAVDRRTPPSAMRGTIEVRESEIGAPVVQIALEFPQMFTTKAHHRTIILNEEEVARLRANEYAGTFEFTLPERLDPAAPAGNE